MLPRGDSALNKHHLTRSRLWLCHYLADASVNRLAKSGQRRLVVTLPFINLAQIVIRPGISWIKLAGPLISSDRFRIVANRLIDAAQVIPGDRFILVTLLSLQRLAISGNSRLVFAPFGINETQVVIGPGIIRV